MAIALVALVVLGPDKLPAALRQAGALLGQVRRMSDSFRIDVNAALAEDAVDRPGAEPRID